MHCRRYFFQILAWLILGASALPAHAFQYPVTTLTEVNGSYPTGSVRTTAALRKMSVPPDETYVPAGYIMQPALWLASDPSSIWISTPPRDCTWYCVRSTGEKLSSLTSRWGETIWTSDYKMPNPRGAKVCSGVVIHAGENTGWISASVFYVGQHVESACGYPVATCTLDSAPVTLSHGLLSETEADGHSASTSLSVNCSDPAYARITLRSGADSQRIALDNGGKSRLFVEGRPIGSLLSLAQGANSLALSDKLELGPDIKLGDFRGSAVLVLTLD